jgi:hypothetical protein
MFRCSIETDAEYEGEEFALGGKLKFLGETTACFWTFESVLAKNSIKDRTNDERVRSVLGKCNFWHVPPPMK